MLLHLIHDDKFIDMAYDIFEEAFLGQNDYIIIGSKRTLKYIKRTPCKFISLTNFAFNPLYIDHIASKYKVILIHYLDSNKQQFIAKLNKKDKKIIWIGWGGDYYDIINKNLILPKTKTILKKIDAEKEKKNNISIKANIKKMLKSLLFKEVAKLTLINEKVDVFAPVIYEDYLLIKNSVKEFKPAFADWNYGTLEGHLIKNKNLKVNGDNILVGNSATFENNHLDTFCILKDLDLGNRKVIVPLSYGDNIYANKIIELGKYYFGDRFIPITDFLPIEKYQKILKSCSIFIFNHLRQQAVGNIVMALYMGGKVFLNKDNPLSSFLERIGISWFPISSLKNAKILEFKLDEENIKKNKDILKKYWDKEIILKKTKNLILNALGEIHETKQIS